MISHWGFNLHLLNSSDVEYLFICSFSILISFTVKCFCKSFAYFPDTLFSFSQCSIHLYILRIRILSSSILLNLSFFAMNLSLNSNNSILLMESFGRVKVSNFMDFHICLSLFDHCFHTCIYCGKDKSS